jgi:RecT family
MTNQTHNDAQEVTAEVIERLPPTLQEVDPMRQWEAMLAQAQTLVRSGFLPKAINTAEKALAVMQTGKELGIGAMQSLRAIHIIDGKPTMSAELIAGLVLSRIPGAMLRVVETTEDRCVVHAARPGHEPTPFVFTMQDAKQAGIASKDNWRKYPRAMLRSRAITEAARAIFPDATMGLYDADELGAITGERGEIVALPPTYKTREDLVQEDIEITTHGSADEAKRQKILAKALAELEPLVAGSPRYLWAMDRLFRSRDWNVIKGFSLKKLDADTRGRFARIVEQAKVLTDEEIALPVVEAPLESIVGEETIPSKTEVERITADLLAGKTPKNAIKANLIPAIRAYIERIPEGPAREAAMSNAFASTNWGELDAYTVKEIEEVVEGGRLTRIVEDALKGTK